MNDARHEYGVLVAQLMLTQWYVTWDSWRDHSDPDLRRLALSSKLKGLISHDRVLIRAHTITRRRHHARPVA